MTICSERNRLDSLHRDVRAGKDGGVKFPDPVSQEFTLRWSAEVGGPLIEIVRQQWTFSSQGSASEVEDYQVQLENLTILELTLKPDLTPDYAFATLSRCRVAYAELSPIVSVLVSSSDRSFHD